MLKREEVDGQPSSRLYNLDANDPLHELVDRDGLSEDDLRQINELMQSGLIEEKQYTAYTA
ncbi:MAG: hypothetical protein J0H89_08820 [Rhizobiales bacterium]|nr:hypothetical protein [Hyphomicrobiales bacterium]